MKTENFKNALELSAEELAEAIKVKSKLKEITEEEIRFSEVRTGFKFMDIAIFDYPKNCVIRVNEDVSTYVHTSLGLVEVNKKIGEVLLNSIKEMQAKNEFINVKLLPL